MAVTLTRDEKIAKAKGYVAVCPTRLLVQSLRDIGPQIDAARTLAKETKDYDHCQALNLTRSWIIGALEARYPETSAIIDAAFEASDDVDYDAVMIAAIPASER